jgi:hypothetical protein
MFDPSAPQTKQALDLDRNSAAARAAPAEQAAILERVVATVKETAEWKYIEACHRESLGR